MFTTEEWLVIAAAAVVFVIANIIMWKIIIAKERRAKLTDINNEVRSRTIRVGQELPSPQDIDPPERTKHFRIKENIVIIHTDERIQ